MFSAKFGRLITAMVTPFQKDLSLDFDSLERLIEHLIQNKTTSLLITGTTGENPTLTYAEEWELLKTTKSIVKGRIPIIFGAGSNSTQTACETSCKAEELGADAILSICPYYNKPNQEGIFAHFSAIASSVKLPIILYNNPGRTCSSLEATTVFKLNEKFTSICAIKESSGSLDAITQLKLKTEKVEIYCGDDNLILPALSVGAVGAVSVTSHIAGLMLNNLIEKFLNGNNQEAVKIHSKLFNLFKILFSSPSPGPVKYLLKEMGICEDYLRLPLTPPTETVRNSLKQIFNELCF